MKYFRRPRDDRLYLVSKITYKNLDAESVRQRPFYYLELQNLY